MRPGSVAAAFLACVTLSAVVPAQVVPALTAEQIVARHIAARGGEAAMRAITSLTFDHGAYSEQGTQFDTSAVMMLKRPYFKLVGHPARTPDFMEGYDGAAWEWFKDPGIAIRTTGAASEASRHYADVDGPFLDYQAKHSTVALIGTSAVGERAAYQVRLTMVDGYATDFFIDTTTFLILASRHTAKIHAFGKTVSSETRFEDYRPVAGVMMPFKSREVALADGRELNAMQWGSISANQDIPDAWFSPPVFTRTPIQAFMEQLFVQRVDSQAVLWTYFAFRRTHPMLDTRQAAEVIGYQILKEGQVATAIALLERNATDYPNAANSAFGLGRAFATASRVADARREFERALVLDPAHQRARQALAALPKSR